MNEPYASSTAMFLGGFSFRNLLSFQRWPLTWGFERTVGAVVNTDHGAYEMQKTVDAVKAGRGWRWLAATPEGEWPNIAVFGLTEDEAIKRLTSRRSAWEALRSGGGTERQVVSED